MYFDTFSWLFLLAPVQCCSEAKHRQQQHHEKQQDCDKCSEMRDSQLEKLENCVGSITTWLTGRSVWLILSASGSFQSKLAKFLRNDPVCGVKWWISESSGHGFTMSENIFQSARLSIIFLGTKSNIHHAQNLSVALF